MSKKWENEDAFYRDAIISVRPVGKTESVSNFFRIPFPRQAKITSCRRAAATICPAPLLPSRRPSAFRRRADGNVAAVSNGQHVLTPTAAAAWRANTAVSKAAWWPWSLTFWSWKWCPSHVSVLIFVSLGLSRLRPNVRDRQMSDSASVARVWRYKNLIITITITITSDRRQTKASLIAAAY